MKKIIFIFLFFCLAITTVLAQVATINIATPNSNGLSNNQVNSFDVNSDGTILNNSATGGTAQLGNTGLAANNNITGSEVDLILFQVTGSSGSGLNGAIEVFGGEAGLIIANPNGISCNGCGFINTSKVDLVTGTANFSGDDLTGFSIDGSSTLNVSGSGFVNDALADELNLVSRNINTVAQAKANTTLRFLAGNDTYDHTTNIITSNATETSGPHSIWISGDLEANYIELISTEISSGGIYGIVNHGEDISADRLKIDSNGLFRNQNDGTNVGSINISGLLEVINAERFINNANITAEILSITTDEFFNNDNGSTQLGNIVVTDTFSLSTPNASYTNTGTVSSDSLNLTIGGDFVHYSTTLNNFTFNNLGIITDGSFFNDYSTINANDFNVTAGTYFWNYATINANNFSVTAGDFENYSTISADNFNVTAGTSFWNYVIINANNFSVTAGDFENYSRISADNFNVTAVNNFNNRSSATISADSFNVTAGGNFQNRDNGTINAGSFNVTTERDFVNRNEATIDVDSFNVTAGAYFSNYGSTINADNFNVITEKDFANQSSSTIEADSFNVTAGKDFYYDGDVDFELAANDSLVVLGNASFNVDNFRNYGKIDVANNLTVYANSFINTNTEGDGTITADTFALSVEGDFDYASDFLGNGNIEANNQYFTIRNGDFTNNTSIVLAGDFGVSADDFINTNGDITVDRFTLSVEGDFDYASDFLGNGNIDATHQNFTIRNGDFTNNTSIVLAGDFGVTANDFINTNGDITADTFTLSVEGDFDYASDFLGNGNIDATHQNFTIRNGDFTNNTSIVLAGDFGVTADRFNHQYGSSINVYNFSVTAGTTIINSPVNADNFSVTAGGFFHDSGIINANDFNVTAISFENYQPIYADNFNVTTGSGFYNYSYVESNIISISAKDFINVHTGGTEGDIYANTLTISVEGDFDYEDDYLDNGNIGATNALNLNVGGDFSYDDSANDFGWGDSYTLTVSGSASFNVDDFLNYGKINVGENLNVTAGDDFYNYGEIDVGENLNVTAGDDFRNYGEIDVAIDLNVAAEDFFENYGEIDIADDLDVIADYFFNWYSGTISAGSFNDTITLFSNNGVMAIGDSRDFGSVTIGNVNNVSIVPDGTTLTNAIQSSPSGIDIINIAQPDSNGLSNNSYSDFNILSSGLVFNNSSSAVSSSLAGTIAGNPNYAASDSASLILNQITSNNVSYLGGILEVVGDSAAIIIANPNGIFCDVCSFVNTDKVDLITGTANFDTTGVISDYTTAANDVWIYNANIVLSDFNVVAGDDFINVDGNISADTFNVTANDFYNYETINADTFNVTANDFYNYETINANDFNVTTDYSFYNRDNATINANDFNVTLTGNSYSDFHNEDSATINADNFNVTAAGNYSDFHNEDRATINADDFNVTAGDDFFNHDGATINANDFNVTAGDYFSNSSSATINANDFNVTADNYTQSGAIDVAGDLRIQVSGEASLGDNASIKARNLFFSAYDLSNQADITITENATFDLENDFKNGFRLDGTDYYGGDIIVGSFNVIAGNNFINRYRATTISADSFNVTAGGQFRNLNEATINADSFNVTSGTDFANEVAGTINANDFNVTTGTHFSNFYASSTINANSFNVTTGTYFANNNSGKINATDFNVTAENDFENDGAINSDTVTIEVTNFDDDIYNTGTVSSDSLNFILTDNFTHSSTSFGGFNNFNNLGITTAGFFYNEADLTVNDLNVTAYYFYNQDSATISADNFNGAAEYYFINDDNATISADNFNVRARYVYNRDNATINVNDFNVLASHFNNYATIDANDFNVRTGRWFYNKEDITANNFNVTAGSEFVNDSFGTINANSFNVTAGTYFSNEDSATINANSFNVTAGSYFQNIDSATISADTVSLSVAGDFDYVADFDGTIDFNSINLNVGGDFSNNDSANDFTWGANDTLTVSGSAFIDAADFKNNGVFNVGDLNITAAGDFNNYATIDAENFNVTVVNSFNNRSYATINAASFNATADYFFNETNAEITARECDIFHTTFYNDQGTISIACYVEVIDIARPDVNGISNNIYTDFNIFNSGTVLNNSDSAGTSQLVGDISANTNYNSGDAASIILNQVTGTNISLLERTLEVFGSEAVVVIANPNGISCNGCSFINASRVDLVTGSNYNLATDTFDSIANTNIAIIDDGFDASSVGILNIHAGSFTNTGGLNANILNLNVVGDFDNTKKGIINATSFNLNVGGDFSNNDSANDFTWGANDTVTVSGSANITADSFNNSGTITVVNNSLNVSANTFVNTGGVVSADTFALSVAGDFDYVADYLNGTITTNAFNLNVGDDFSNNDASSDFTWGANDTLTVSGSASVVVDSFNNSGNITVVNNSLNVSANTFVNTGGVVNADTFSLSVAGDFDYIADYLTNGTITTNAFNLNVGGDFSNNDASSDFTWGANDTVTVSGSASVVAASFNNSGTINADNFNATATDFTNIGTISANTTLNTTVSSTESDSFNNTGGVLIADTFSLSVAGDFDYIADYLNNGTITTNAFNLNVGGDFSNNDASSDFTWGANDTLTVSGSASVVADSFNNSGTIAITNNSLNITTNAFVNTGGVVNTDTLNLNVAGDFDYANGTITTNALNLTVGGDFSYDDSANDFTWGANDILAVSGSANITADSFNNSGTITITNNSLNITTNAFDNTGGVVNADTVSLSVAGDFDYDDRGTVTANAYNFNVGGDFSYDDSANNLDWGVNDTLTVLGNSDIVANNFENKGVFNVGNLNITAAGDFDNYATIDADNFNVTVVDAFNNRSDAIISADSFDATAHDFFNRSDAIITANECNIIHTNFYIDQGTINCDYEAEIEVIDIARPDVNGLSNNSYTDFNILNSGIVLNNSDSAGTSQLAGDISANTNYNSGDAASIILNQVTGSNISSLLEGTLEVFGAEAVVIIANPSGITCNGCSFINASRVDLVTGSTYNVATDSFNDIANTNIALIDNGFDASSVGILNIQAGSFTNTGGLKANTFNLSVAGDFDYTNRGTVATNAFNLNVGGDFSNNDLANDFTWGANDTLTVLGSASVTTDSFNNSGTIAVSNSSFDITAASLNNSGTISANTTLNTTVSSTANNSFNNTGGVLSADTVSLSVAGDFDYVADFNGTITTNTLNLNVGGDFSNNDAANDFTWNASDSLTVLGTASITADNFTNFGYIDIANSFNVTAGYRFYNERGAIINANDFNVTAVDRFYNWYGNATINADNFNVSAGKRFYSWTSTINANSFNLTVEEFYNEKNATLNATNNFNVTADNFTNTDGNINADIFSLSVAGDFDYVAEYLGNGTITTNTLNLNVVGDFSNNDAANDFTWGANDTLTVLGTASVVADSFSNSGTIAVSNSSFDITAASLNNSGTISANTTLNTTLTSTTSNSFTNTGGVLNATAFALSVAGDFDYVAEYLGNGTITTNTINLNVGGNFSNNDANNDFTWGANDTLTVLGSASVVADSFNNSGNINVANSSFDITAASLNNSGTISANSFNATVDSFINEASATITAAECNIVYTTYTDSGTITCLDSVAGDTTIIDIARPDANGLSNNSYETFHIPSNGIVLNNSDSAGTSQLAGSISANTNYNSGDAASLILAQVTGNDISLLFGALEVFGAEAGVIIANPSGITCNACSFINASRVDLVTGSNYNVATDTFDSIANTNIALIDDGFDASSVGILNIQAGSFTNTGGLEANTFNLNVVGNFDYTNRGTITTNALNLNVGGDFSNNDANNDFVWGANDTLTVLGTASVVAASFNNSGTIAVSNSSFDITATDFTNAGTISANTTLNTTLASTANNSFNNTGGVISADTVSLSVAGDFDDTKKGIINANYFNLTAGGSFINDDTNNDFVLAENDSLSISGDFTIATNNYIQSGMVDVDGALDISTMGDFTNNTGGDISADTLAITVGGIIDNDGTITTTSLTIDTDTIHNSGDITATTSLNINATNDVFSGGSITTNALDIEAGRNFANGGTISTDSFEITAGYTVINKGSIASDSLDVTTDDFFRNLTGGEINVATLNITAGGKVTNTATIDVSGILSITANNDSARDDDPAGAFFYVSNRGNITATDLNIAAVDNFYNRGNITTTSSFTTSAKNVFLLNEEIDSFVGTYDGGNISLSGDSSFTADSRIENYGNIDLGSNILDISADSFTNHAGATIDAATLNLDVNSLIQNGFINAVINHQ